MLIEGAVTEHRPKPITQTRVNSQRAPKVKAMSEVFHNNSSKQLTGCMSSNFLPNPFAKRGNNSRKRCLQKNTDYTCLLT